ncbi:MAG: hypothetical protein V1880_04445 [Patescibacteria group bacterium]
MLKQLFSSNARVKLLRTFLLNPDEEFFIRELTRKLSEQINSVRRELDNLKKIGLLKSRVRNRKKYYYINKSFLIFGELRDMFVKASSNDEQMGRAISKMGEVDFLLLTGKFVGKVSSIDLLLIGEVDKMKLQKYLDETLKGKKDIKFTIISKKDFLYRMECNDKFVKEILSGEGNIILINKLKKELERMVK